MKRELKLNFGELRLVQKRVTEFQDALSDIDEAAAYFDDVMGKQESEAAEVLVERHREMEEEIRYFQDILSQLETLLGNYINDMEGHIMPLDENQMMLVDRNDIWWNMKQIGSNLSSAKNVASGTELSYYSGIDTTPSPPHIYEGMSPGAQSAAWARYRRQLLESRNRKANYSKLQSFCSGTAGSAKSSLEEFYDSLEEIYKKHVIEFENTDDDYKRKAAQVYDACTSAGERFWDIGTKIGKLVNDINEGIDAAVYDFVSGIFGLVFTLAKLQTAVRVAIVTVPLGITPQWVKDTGKEAVEGLEGIAAILRNPGRALASLGQQVTDTVEEKGIAYALSYVTADIAIGILVDKGIGKIRGMNKADDLAKISTKVDDVVDAADDLEAGVKAVEKIDDVMDTVDDVADMVDDVAVFGDIESGSKTTYKILNTSSAEDVNKIFKDTMGYEPPYKPGTSVTEIQLTEDTIYVRVYDKVNSRMQGGWVMKAEDIAGLTPQEIQNKFALPNTPKYICDVNLEAGTRLRTGEVNPLFGFDGGGQQFDLIINGRNVGTFTNERIIGQ